MFADYHNHTDFSYDCGLPMETSIRQAIKLGIQDICYTEHFDIGSISSYTCDSHSYYETFKKLKQVYGDKVSLKFGMEFGVQTHTVPMFEKLFGSYPFDFILLSMHQVDNKEFWNQSFQRGKSQKQYIEEYYDELLGIVKKFNNYSVLGHMDVIRRYDRNGDYPFEKIMYKIEDILKIVIENGKGIEVNTSCYRYNVGDLMPSTDIIKLYKKLGGEIITVGSDSHYSEHVGYRVLETQQALSELGFKYVCTFEKMVPTFHSIECKKTLH